MVRSWRPADEAISPRLPLDGGDQAMNTRSKRRSQARVGEDEMETDAWRSLSHAARALLLPIRVRGRPHTNGREKVTIVEIKAFLRCGSAKATSAFRELFEVGFLVKTGRSTGGVVIFRRTEWPARAVGITTATREYEDWKPPPARPKGQTAGTASTAGIAPLCEPHSSSLPAGAEIIDLPRGFLIRQKALG